MAVGITLAVLAAIIAIWTASEFCCDTSSAGGARKRDATKERKEACKPLLSIASRGPTRGVRGDQLALPLSLASLQRARVGQSV